MTKGNTQRTLTAGGKRLLILLCIAFFLTACSAGAPSSPDTAAAGHKTSTTPQTTAEETLSPYSCDFYDAEVVSKNISAAVPYEIDGMVTAAIVPHHAPHMDLLCSLLSSDAIQNEAYDAVVVIGPNHTGEGDPIQLTGRGYYWEHGETAGDADIAAYIASDFRLRVGTDTPVLGTDHAASVLMPYIAHYLPDTDVTAILLSTAVTVDELESLCEDLIALAGEKKLLLLFSVDFSHYQSPDDAKAYDTQTQEAILSANVGKLLSYHNEHFDTPQGVALFVGFAQSIDAGVTRLDHRLTTFTENGTHQAMSYFVFVATTE